MVIERLNQLIKNTKKILFFLRANPHIFVILCILTFFVFQYVKFANSFFYLVSSESIYWFFSSSSQSISALVAFLIAGYTFVYQNLDEEKDETKYEINRIIKSNYYRLLVLLAFCASIAIIGDLVSLIFTKNDFMNFFNFLYVISATFTLITVMLVISFILYIMNPNKEEKVARELYKNTYFRKTKNKVSIDDFMQEFIKLESLLRDYGTKDQNKFWRIQPLRTIVMQLEHEQTITPNQLNDLLHIIEYRNLVVHQGVPIIDQGMLTLTKRMHEQLRDILLKGQR